MVRSYVVQMPPPEARHLAGTGPHSLATPEARCLLAIREWLHGISRRRAATVPGHKIVTDLTAILNIAPPPSRPVRGPFAPTGNSKPTLPGQVEYLGNGIVRLDDTAISILTQLREGADFKVTLTDAGPILAVGADTYPAHEEKPEPVSHHHQQPATHQ